MKFLIEKSIDTFPEADLLKNSITNSHLCHTYEELSMNEVKLSNDSYSKYKDYIPVGTIRFVDIWLDRFHNTTMKTIEVPPCLRTEEFLKRDYKIINKSQIPKYGKYFLKYIDKIKNGSYLGHLENWWVYEKAEPTSNNLFVLSQYVDILSEYRVYVIDNEIKSIVHYDGHPTVLPDIHLIEKAALIISANKDLPKSYTIDIAVNAEGTFILEVHTFSSVGLYTTLLEDLPLAYKQGLDWCINNNYNIMM